MATLQERPSDDGLAAHRTAESITVDVPSSDKPDESKIYDLVIVGYGPAGVTAANFAAQLGLETLIVERETDIFPRQRAIACDDEVLRIFQSIGLVDKIRATMHEGLTMTFVTAKGKEILRLAPEISDNGYYQQNFFHQPWLEQELRAGVARRAETITMLSGWEAFDVTNHTENATVEIRKPGTSESFAVRGRYVLGCDGGSSPIRKALGFAMGGTSYPDKWFDVQGELLRRVPGTPHFKFICDPVRPGVDCPCPGGMHRYEWRCAQSEDIGHMQKHDVLWPMLKEFSAKASDEPDAGIDESHVRIERTWDYTFHVRNAAEWRIGRVMLLGDAAHIMPPFAGQGMSAGIRDSANIVWKIKMVLDGVVRPEFLDTYQAERQKHVAEMTKYSQLLGSIVLVENKALATIRNWALRLMRRIPGIKAYTMSMKAKPAPAISAGFVSSARGRNTPTGTPFPNIDVGTPTGRMLSDDALGFGFRVLGLDCDPREHLPAEAIEAWERLGAEFMRIRTGTLIVGPGEIGDPVGRLYEWFKKYGNAKVAIVRPDHMVYGVDSDNVSLIPPFVGSDARRRSDAAAHRR
ncbi:bifunctional 3-(3-hydroxy-phenyl)propionate/3-hydroxycinnamic acid hydroxylase [Sciscionella marina]|uniref:bifunctional 3-(3-hydroxy-phenyl)propionate/3-hydroxycinnamic acid hydroxylase n=1 Tax=Sciscionella marina TaxID=508770 RepID=UPI000361AD24|nr:bifunctional 3-(3-hydroxy-phenyl)propionate/3-hydroxycinnamic acid hydroxylase [Sciscionella marina]